MSTSRRFPKPLSDVLPNTAAFEQNPLVKPTGFREYDAAIRVRQSHPNSTSWVCRLLGLASAPI